MNNMQLVEISLTRTCGPVLVSHLGRMQDSHQILYNSAFVGISRNMYTNM